MNIIKRRNVVLLLLTLLFVAPGIAAYVFYQHPDWLSQQTTNKGDLLKPPVLFPKLHSGSKWQLMLWHRGDCGQLCLQHMDQLARVRLALGRHLYEVDQWLILGEEAKPLSRATQALLRDQDVHWMHLTQVQRERLSVLTEDSGVFIANPYHYLILAYPLTANPDAIFHDLKQLTGKRG